MKQNKSWLKIKQYAHIGEPLSPKNKHDIQSYVRNEDKIAHHAFFPLIKRNVTKYHYKKTTTTSSKVKRAKTRPICYATHLDSTIYSLYAFKISKYYEKFLYENKISQCITAYRSIPCGNRHGNKCNIDYAKDVFDFIREKCYKEDVAVITFDIKGFFDNLDHKLLKKAWKKICNITSMSNAEYAIYRNIINHSYVDEDKLFELFKDKIICKIKSGKIVTRKIKKKKFFRDKRAFAFCRRCDIAQIRKKGLIRKGNFDYDNNNYTHKGIPQGLPISAILANVYMNEFDITIAKDIDSFGGLYRRYSDDIIIVCPLKYGSFWKEYMIDQIQNVNLNIESSKTNLYTFKTNNNTQIHCKHEILGSNKLLEYLGFSFDGENIRIKNSGLGVYYYKMRKSIERCIYFSVHSHNKKGHGKLFENRLVYRFSQLGSRKHKIFVRTKTKPYYFYDSKRRSLGNYWSYAKKSAEIMDNAAILKQMSRNKHKLKSQILEARKIVPQIIYKRDCDAIMKYGRLY